MKSAAEFITGSPEVEGLFDLTRNYPSLLRGRRPQADCLRLKMINAAAQRVNMTRVTMMCSGGGLRVEVAFSVGLRTLYRKALEGKGIG